MKRSASPHPEQQAPKKSSLPLAHAVSSSSSQGSPPHTSASGLNGYSNPISPASLTSHSPQQRSSPRYQKHNAENHTARSYKPCPHKDEFEFDEVKDKLGEGTFGEVFKAMRKSTKERVALKLILMQNEKEGFPITALREIKILKSLDHVNIVPLIDVAVQPGNKATKENAKIYMVFPYMDHDLSGLLENPSVKFTVPQIKWYLKQLLEGTLYLHSNKILHRDMKAANLLINNEGILKIADFGLARGYIPDERRDYTVHVVTRWYRPPELLLGERKYTAAIDMWGVGCVFAEMLKGKPILQGTSDTDQLSKIWALCGTPTEDTMAAWRNLPGMESITSFPNRKKRISEEYQQFGEEAVSLLEELLALDPAKRLTASGALDHDYLWTPPLLSSSRDIPTWPASHEYDRRKLRQEQRNPVIGAPPRETLPTYGRTGHQGQPSRPSPSHPGSRQYGTHNSYRGNGDGNHYGDYRVRGRRDGRDTRDTRDSRDTRDTRDSRDSRDDNNGWGTTSVDSHSRDPKDRYDSSRRDRDRGGSRDRLVHPLPPKPSTSMGYGNNK